MLPPKREVSYLVSLLVLSSVAAEKDNYGVVPYKQFLASAGTGSDDPLHEQRK